MLVHHGHKLELLTLTKAPSELQSKPEMICTCALLSPSVLLSMEKLQPEGHESEVDMHLLICCIVLNHLR